MAPAVAVVAEVGVPVLAPVGARGEHDFVARAEGTGEELVAEFPHRSRGSATLPAHRRFRSLVRVVEVDVVDVHRKLRRDDAQLGVLRDVEAGHLHVRDHVEVARVGKLHVAEMPVAVEELQLGVLAAVVRGERHRHPLRTGHRAVLDALAGTEVREDFAAGRARNLVVRSGPLALRVRQHLAALRLDTERLLCGRCTRKREDRNPDFDDTIHRRFLR